MRTVAIVALGGSLSCDDRRPEPSPPPGVLILTIDERTVGIHVESPRGATVIDTVVAQSDESALRDELRRANELRSEGSPLRVVTNPCTSLRALSDVMLTGFRATTGWTGNMVVELDGAPAPVALQFQTWPAEWASRAGIQTHPATYAFVGDADAVRFVTQDRPIDARFAPTHENATLRAANATCGRTRWTGASNLATYLASEPQMCAGDATLVAPPWLSLGLLLRIRDDLHAASTRDVRCGDAPDPAEPAVWIGGVAL